MYSQTEHIVEGLYFNRAKNVWVAMLTLYADDSGTSPMQDCAVAAGWIAKMPSWKLFDKEWKRIANVESRKIECLHMADFVSGYKAFENWGNLKEKSAVLKKLRVPIKKRALRGFSLAVVKKDFDDLVPDELRNQGFKNHYTYAVRSVLGMIHKWRIEHKLLDEPIEYFFDFMDRNDPRRKEIENVFETVGNADQNLKFYGIHKEPTFVSKKEIPALQAADMFAWTIYQAMLDERGKGSIKNIAVESFQDFISSHHGHEKLIEGGYNTRTQIIDWIRKKGIKPLLSA